MSIGEAVCLVSIRIADEEDFKGVWEDDPPVLPLVRTGFHYFFDLFLPNCHLKFPFFFLFLLLFLVLFYQTTRRERDTEKDLGNLGLWRSVWVSYPFPNFWEKNKA